MNRSVFRIAAHIQLALAVVLATGCTSTQPFFLNESPDLQYYLNHATQIEYPDVEVDSLAETTEALPPLTLGNHEYVFWDLTVEECVNIALQNAKVFVAGGGNAEFRQNQAAQFVSGTAPQVGTIYDIPIQQSTTQSIPLTIDGAGNRILPRGVLRANQIGGVEDALAEFDAQASGFVDFSTTDRPRNTGPANTVNPQLFESTDVTQQAALSKRFATGGVATLREQVIYSRNNVPIDGFARAFPSDYTVVMEAQVRHPLMRNRGTLINRVPVVLASLNEDVAITDFEIRVRNLVRDVEVAYWNLYTAYRNVSTSIVARNSALATAYFAKLALENGTGTIQELAQAQGQYFTFRAQLEGALSGSNLAGDGDGVYGGERRLRELMGLAPTDGRLIRPIQEPTLARVEFDWEEIKSELLYLSPELRQRRIQIQQRELELLSAKNQILPQVDISMAYRWIGFGDTFGPPTRQSAEAFQPGSSALSQLTRGDYQEGTIRLEITPPAIGARRELTRIRGSQLQIKRERVVLIEQERLLISQLSDAISDVDTHYQLTQTQAQAWKEAELEVESRLAEFKAGRSPVNVVLQSQQRRADAQIRYYQALSAYNTSLNLVDYYKGTLLANSSITLAEGPWNSKAYQDALERARERSAGKKLQYGVSRPGVVRRGPLRATAEGGDFVGSGLVPPGPAGEGQDPFGAVIEPMRQPVDIPDNVPLSELGNTPQELFAPPQTLSPGDSMDGLGPGADDPLERGFSAPPNNVQQMGYEPTASTAVGDGLVPQPVRRKAVPHQ